MFWSFIKTHSFTRGDFLSFIAKELYGGFPGGSVVKNPPAIKERQVQSLGWENYPGEGNGNPLQYSCLESPMDRGAWRAIVHRVTKNQT